MASVSNIPNWLQVALEKPVAVFGSGVSGESAKGLLELIGGTVVVYDESESGLTFDDVESARIGLVVLSPGFAVDHRWVAVARQSGCHIVGEVDLASLFWSGPIVAITGTNGKTTLTEFLTHAFVYAGMEAYSVGNIGTPLSARVVDGTNTESVAVCELSSFQTETLQHMSPDYVLWTNFDEDHLDRHETMESYFTAKYQLVERAVERGVYYDESVASAAAEYGRSLDSAGLVERLEQSIRERLEGTALADGIGLRCFAMAASVWKAWGLDIEVLLEATRDFKKSPHRMEQVGEIDGVGYWNDSKATNFHAALGALGSFAGPVHWIGGGKSKGGDIVGFANHVLSHVKAVYLVGETKFELQSVFLEHDLEAPVFECLESALSAVQANVQSGDQVVFSPGFASFDQFEGYAQRGDFFKKAVAEIGILK